MASASSDCSTPNPMTSSRSSRTEVILTPEEPLNVEPPTLRLSLRKPSTEKKVSWNSGTVDNEHMGKKKSKCCCIYKKQREFGESSSESEDDECDNCFGHVEKKKKNSKNNGEHSKDDGNQNNIDGNLPDNG